MNVEASLEKIGNAQDDLVRVFIENDLSPQEGLSLMTGLIVHMYTDLAKDNSRDAFISTMTKCYDACTLLKSEPEGSIQ